MTLAISLPTLEGVNETVAAEYKKQDDGTFKLDVSGLEDTGALKRAKDHEKTHRQTAETSLGEAEAANVTLQETIDEMRRGNIPKGDVDALEASWKEKLATANTTNATAMGVLQTSLNELLVDNVASHMASEISTAPDLLIPHITKRLQADNVDGKAITRVLGTDGKPSAITIEELQKEFVANDKFAAIIVGSKASGGGAEQKKPGGGAADKGLDYAGSSPKEITAHIKANKESQ